MFVCLCVCVYVCIPHVDIKGVGSPEDQVILNLLAKTGPDRNETCF